ncbi:MAG: hypothetical protein QOE26_380 [Verrucomicrobiota bacterium]
MRKHNGSFAGELSDDVVTRLELDAMAHIAPTEGKGGRGCNGNEDHAECHRPNENKISDGYRERAPIEVEVFQSWEMQAHNG